MTISTKTTTITRLTIFSFFFLALMSFTTSGGGIWVSTAGVTIPAQQEFVLGEYDHPNYKALLNNKSDYVVEIEIRDRETNEITQSFGLGENSQEEVNVSKSEKVILKNGASVDVLVKVKLSKNVQGMRYQELDSYE